LGRRWRGASAEKLAVIARQRGIEHPIRITALKTHPRGASGKINRAELAALMHQPADARRSGPYVVPDSMVLE
jgi:acyl-coenzyme A synthetase/AMP-(fatty) acid ligase